jgi:hypothetical protein
MDALASPPRHVKQKRAKPASPAQLHVQPRFADFAREASIAAADLSGFKYISKGERPNACVAAAPGRWGPAGRRVEGAAVSGAH